MSENEESGWQCVQSVTLADCFRGTTYVSMQTMREIEVVLEAM
jgi:hypothetical protein